MASSSTPALRPSAAWKSIFRASRAASLRQREQQQQQQQQQRRVSLMGHRTANVTENLAPMMSAKQPKPQAKGEGNEPGNLMQLVSPKASSPTKKAIDRIKVYPPPANPRARCPDPIAALTQQQLSVLDSTGARAHLFNRKNAECAKVGDILLVRQRNGDPFAGVCINIRRRGVDTAILLRNQLTRVGVEMWYKIYSPNVEAIEVVQRREKRARRARLYYMRKPRHDIGSVENIVRQYRMRSQQLGSGQVRSRDANSHKKKKKKNSNKNKRGRN